MFLLDTNVVSELRQATFGKADPGVTAAVPAARPDQLPLVVAAAFTLHQRRQPAAAEHGRQSEMGDVFMGGYPLGD